MESDAVNLETFPERKPFAEYDFETLQPGVAYPVTVDGKPWQLVAVDLHEKSLKTTRHYYVFPQEKEDHDNGTTCDIYVGYRVDPLTRMILEKEKKVFKCFKEKYSSPQDCADEFALLQRQRFCPELFQLNGRIYIVMNYVEGEYLTRASLTQKLPEDNSRALWEVVKIAWLGTQELFNLHHRTIRGGPWIHTDIRPLNILWNLNDVQLIDFGLASKDGESDQPFVDANTAFEQTETDPYIAPEMKVPQGERAYKGVKSDIYSWGVIVRDIFKVVNVPREVKGLLDKMINNMLQENYTDRPSIDDVLLFFTAFRLYCLKPADVHIETLQCLISPGETAIAQDEATGAFPLSAHNLAIVLEKEKHLDEAIYRHIDARTVQEKEMFLDALILKRSNTDPEDEASIAPINAMINGLLEKQWNSFVHASPEQNSAKWLEAAESVSQNFMQYSIERRLQFLQIVNQFETDANKAEIKALKDNVATQLAMNLAKILNKLPVFSYKTFAARRLKYAVTDNFTFFNTHRRRNALQEALIQKPQAMREVLADLATPALAA